jgi:hypothetical protein
LCRKGAGRSAFSVGDIHRDVFIFLHIADGQAGGQHGIFKRKTAAQQKADHIVTEIVADIFNIYFKFTVFKNFDRLEKQSNEP